MESEDFKLISTWPLEAPMYPQVTDGHIFGATHAKSRDDIRLFLEPALKNKCLTRENLCSLARMYRDTLKALDDQSKHYSKSDLRDAFLGEIQGLCHEYIQTICELLRHCKEPGEIARYCTSIAKFHDTLSVFWRLRKNKGHAKAHSDVAYQAHRIATRSAEPPDLDLLDAIVAFAMFQRYRLNLREESLDILAQAHRGGISCRERLHQAQSLTSGMLDLFDQYFNRLSGMSKKWHTEDSLEGVAVPPGDLT